MEGESTRSLSFTGGGGGWEGGVEGERRCRRVSRGGEAWEPVPGRFYKEGCSREGDAPQVQALG